MTEHTFAGNRVTRDTGSRFPIFQAPIGMMSRSQWVTAISGAGGMGLMETHMLDSAGLKTESDLVRGQTNQPFGYHMLVDALALIPDHEKDVVDWLVKRQAPFVTLGTSREMQQNELDQWRHLPRLKDVGTTCYAIVETVDEALRAEDAGIDGIILSGAETGGVRGRHELHIFTFIQRIKQKVDVPLVASGGIVDGHGMAGAFALGAEGVLMGTRFMASTECPIHAGYKGELAGSEHVLYVEWGHPQMRFLAARNAYSEAVFSGEIDGRGNPYGGDARRCFYEGRTDLAMVGGGESMVLFDSIKPVAEIMNETVDEFWQEMERLAGLLSPAKSGSAAFAAAE